MKNIGIFYGSSTGSTEGIAKTLAEKLNADLFDVASNPIDELAKYQNLIFGVSTWGYGDLQDDWDAFLSKVQSTDLSGKKIALFGLGDCESYPDTYVDGIGIIYEAIKDKSCKIIGQTETAGYTFNESKAVVDGKFIGLALDEDNYGNSTAARIDKWVAIISEEMK